MAMESFLSSRCSKPMLSFLASPLFCEPIDLARFWISSKIPRCWEYDGIVPAIRAMMKKNFFTKEELIKLRHELNRITRITRITVFRFECYRRRKVSELQLA